MRDPELALMTIPDTGHRIAIGRLTRPHLLAAFGVAALLSVSWFLVGVPLASICVIASLLALVLASTSCNECARRPLALPEGIVSIELRETYRLIVVAQAEVERAVADAPRLRSVVEPVLERCTSAVQICERLALLANPLQRYLDAHDVGAIRDELERLRLRTEAATDEQVASALGHAIAARTNQLAAHEQISTMRERIHARLELCRAALASFAASLVRLQVADEEQIVLAAGTVTEHLDGIGDELESLESVITLDLAA